MAQTNIRRTNKTGSRRSTLRQENEIYVYGNTARRLDVQRQLEEAPKRQPSHEVRKNRDKARHMNLGYVVFLIGALCTVALILVNYIQLQADLTNRINNIARLESELNTKKLTNDEEYSRLTSSVDLEEIKRVAIGELGMTYAGEGQIITYSTEGNDYMRKVADDEN